MKNNRHLVQKTDRVTCIRAPTGDAKRPLACVWVETAAPQSVSATSSKLEIGRLQVCA